MVVVVLAGTVVTVVVVVGASVVVGATVVVVVVGFGAQDRMMLWVARPLVDSRFGHVAVTVSPADMERLLLPSVAAKADPPPISARTAVAAAAFCHRVTGTTPCGRETAVGSWAWHTFRFQERVYGNARSVSKPGGR